MAQVLPGFSATAVREGLRLAMEVGMPVDPERRPQFVTIPAPAGIDPTVADADGIPWDPSVVADLPDPILVRVLCAIEWIAPAMVLEHFGERQPTTIHITLLDEEYELVEGFTYVNLWPATEDAAVRFTYRKVFQQVTLDAIGVWILECTTEDTV